MSDVFKPMRSETMPVGTMVYLRVVQDTDGVAAVLYSLMYSTQSIGEKVQFNALMYADAMAVSTSTVFSKLAKLERAGFVKRHRWKGRVYAELTGKTHARRVRLATDI